MTRLKHVAIHRICRFIANRLTPWAFEEGWRQDTWGWFASTAWWHEEVAEGRGYEQEEGD